MVKFILGTLLIASTAVAGPKPETVKLTRKNSIPFVGAYTEETMEMVRSQVLQLIDQNPKEKKYYLVLSSPGGNPENLKTTIEKFKKIKKLEMICLHCSSAMAAFFVNQNKRLLLPHFTMVIHEMKVLAPPRIIKDMGIDNLIAEADFFNSLFFTKMKWDKKKYEEWVFGKDNYVDQQFALKNNLADRVVNAKCDDEVSLMAPTFCGLLEGELSE